MLDLLWRDRWATTRSAVQLRYVVPVVRSEVGQWPLAAVTYGDLQDYATGLLRAGLSPATANRRLSLISSALREGYKRSHCAHPPPMPRLRESTGRDRYITSEEEHAILAEFERRKRDAEVHKRPEWEYMAMLVVALLDTGARLSEILGTRREDLRGDMLQIANHRTKNQRGRMVPLTPRALEALTKMVSHSCHAVASVDWAGHRFTLAVQKTLKLSDVVLHVLRHTCAARLLAAGVDIYTVSKWLGHSSVKVTERYAKLQTGMLFSARAALMRNR